MGQAAPTHFGGKANVAGRLCGCAGLTMATIYPALAVRRGDVSLVINCAPKLLRTQNPAPTRLYCFIG